MKRAIRYEIDIIYLRQPFRIVYGERDNGTGVFVKVNDATVLSTSDLPLKELDRAISQLLEMMLR